MPERAPARLAASVQLSETSLADHAVPHPNNPGTEPWLAATDARTPLDNAAASNGLNGTAAKLYTSSSILPAKPVDGEWGSILSILADNGSMTEDKMLVFPSTGSSSTFPRIGVQYDPIRLNPIQALITDQRPALALISTHASNRRRRLRRRSWSLVLAHIALKTACT
ncbi:hypothetical protein PaG_01737 [Moesziomyces aphidis]|uniref:Uncharacterized protein n=1 Tax=Moesziomyces aphidis TaxID=84754 RepID=W3VP48_MOEAP|nr:hypothetical protein PaG_01737 [Moesziomyces aphidis]